MLNSDIKLFLRNFEIDLCGNLNGLVWKTYKLLNILITGSFKSYKAAGLPFQSYKLDNVDMHLTNDSFHSTILSDQCVRDRICNLRSIKYVLYLVGTMSHKNDIKIPFRFFKMKLFAGKNLISIQSYPAWYKLSHK